MVGQGIRHFGSKPAAPHKSLKIKAISTTPPKNEALRSSHFFNIPNILAVVARIAFRHPGGCYLSKIRPTTHNYIGPLDIAGNIFRTQLFPSHHRITSYFRIVSILCCTATSAATIVDRGHAWLEAAIILTRKGIPLAGKDCALGLDGDSSTGSGAVCASYAACLDRACGSC